MTPTLLEEVCKHLGVPAKEILDLEETESGVVVHMFDESEYIIVPADRPDGAGRSGVLRYGRWRDTYRGPMALYERPRL